MLTLLDAAGMKSIQAALEECDLVVDALLGTGLSRTAAWYRSHGWL